jgi:hypothetical protein
MKKKAMMRLSPEAMIEIQRKTERIRERSTRFRKLLDANAASFSGGINVTPEPEKNIKRCWETEVLEAIYRDDGR